MAPSLHVPFPSPQSPSPFSLPPYPLSPIPYPFRRLLRRLLGAHQEAERLRLFGTGSVEQCAPFYSFLGRHFLSPVYSFPSFIGPPRMAFNRRRRSGFSFHSLTVPNFPKVEEAPLFGGYDDEFVNAVEDDLQCSICHLPLKDPMQTKCGHRCCKTCLDEHFKRFAFLINAK